MQKVQGIAHSFGTHASSQESSPSTFGNDPLESEAGLLTFIRFATVGQTSEKADLLGISQEAHLIQRGEKNGQTPAMPDPVSDPLARCGFFSACLQLGLVENWR